MAAPRRFGGLWTEQKLKILTSYLSSYTKVLKNQNFSVGYIDAFAGSGTRVSPTKPPPLYASNLFDTADQSGTRTWDGSVRLALSIEPSFDGYVFIELDPKACRDLEAIKEEYKDRKIIVIPDDANRYLQKFCKAPGWSKRRAVVFLDPYGTAASWETLKAIAATKAIDVWVLFPSGVGVNRMLPRDGQIDPNCREHLNRLFGTTDWEDQFYSTFYRADLFDGQTVSEKRRMASVQQIGEYYDERLRSIFSSVGDRPAILVNSKGGELFRLFFATNTSSLAGRKAALNIANHIIKKLG